MGDSAIGIRDSRFLFCFFLLLLSTAFAVAVWAQTPTGGIDGTVADQSNAVIPGATVAITEKATARVINLTTNESGRYSVRNLLPGVYELRIEAAGFNTPSVPMMLRHLPHANLM